MVMSVINLCVSDRENTHRITNADELMIIGTGAHVVLITDNQTTMGRILKYEAALKDIALSIKFVNYNFTRQFIVSHKDWSFEQ